jgi:hypothetical protein
MNWSVSCRFCSQKFNLLVFLIGIADHAGPLVQYLRFCSQKFNLFVFLIGIADHARTLVNMHRTEWQKERKKAKSHTQAQNKSYYKTEVFLLSLLTYLVLTCDFGTSTQCAQQPWGPSLCGFHVAFHMLRLLDEIFDIKKADVSR